MSRHAIWATKITTLIKGGNSTAALAQIKVAPSVKDLEQLKTMLILGKLLALHPNIEQGVANQMAALSHPRLHRSP